MHGDQAANIVATCVRSPSLWFVRLSGCLAAGLYDPWSVFGVMEDVNDSVVAVIIPEGAHHLDLMFR